MAAAQDLLCIVNLLKQASDEVMTKRKTRADQNKSDDSPICTLEHVQALLRVVVEQLIERQDNQKVEITSSKDEEISNLKEELSLVKKENSELRQMQDDAQQYNRRDNLKIIGVPYQKGENVVKIVQDIAKHTTGEDLHESEISVAHRIISKENKIKLEATPFNPNAQVTPKNAPSIIVKFCRRDTKTKVFESRKQTAAKPHSPYPRAEIYEDVTPLRSRILYALRNRKDEHDNKVYRYVWSREGRLYCHTEAESKQDPRPEPHKITCPEDLAKLGWLPSEIQDIIHKKHH